MAEIGELFKQAVAHDEPEEECPFCPAEPPQDFITYPGKANKPDILRDVMANPACLTTKQKNARPKDGNPYPLKEKKRSVLDQPQYSNTEYGKYTFQAHHAISGNQAMKGHAIERWILAKKNKIKRDTGYSINNSDNGVWLPSHPDKFGKGKLKWKPLSDEEKLKIASLAMDEGLGQFHLGPHNVVDPSDPDGKYHESYDKRLKNLLSDLDELIEDWSNACFICKGKNDSKLEPTWQVNEMLDRLSQAVMKDLKGSPCSWYYFISSLALTYHEPRCSHKYIDG